MGLDPEVELSRVAEARREIGIVHPPWLATDFGKRVAELRGGSFSETHYATVRLAVDCYQIACPAGD